MIQAEWWFAKDGNRYGPISVEEIESKLISDQMATDTLVWCQGMDNWKTLKEVDTFADFWKNCRRHWKTHVQEVQIAPIRALLHD